MSTDVDARRTPEELREQVVAAALRLFASRGYAGTSVQHIADEVGASKQLVLYHFHSKPEIRKAVLHTLTDYWKEFLPELLDVATQSSEDRMGGVIEAFQGYLEEHPAALRFVLRDLITEGGEVRDHLYQLVHPWMRLTAESLQQAKDLGPDAATRAMAQVQLVGILLLSVYSVQPPDAPGPEGEAFTGVLYDEMITMIRAYLQAGS